MPESGVGHRPGCLQTLRIVEAILEGAGSKDSYSIVEVEVAFIHLSRCSSCQGRLTIEERRMFTSRVLLAKG